MLIRIVRLTFQPEKIEAFLENFHLTKNQIRAFEGCSHLELWRDKDKPNVFITYSHWQSEEALENYRKSALFQEVWTFTKALFADRPMAFSAIQQEIVKIE